MVLEPQARGLEAEIVSRFREHDLLDIAEPEVRVRQGIAYIGGPVPNLKQKRLATEVASQTKGVRVVVNMLRITPLPVIDDEALKKRIRRALARNPEIDQSKISVEVVNGVVYLGGFVSIATDKRLAEHEVWALAGVKDTINKIDVISAISKSEMQVIGEILQSFSECLGLDQSKVTVEMRDGIVRLNGIVPTDYLRDAAEELATWVPSVSSVINELQVLELPVSRGYSRLGLGRSPVEECSPNAAATDSGSPAGRSNTLGAPGARSSSNVHKTTTQA